MNLVSTLRRSRRAEPLPGLTGVARVDHRTRRLLARVRRGDIVVLDHVDLDRGTAQALVCAGVAAVVNAAPSISGRYPNLGPEVLVAAGVLLVDRVGPEVFAMVSDGDTVRLHEGALYKGEQFLVAGDEQDARTVTRALQDARHGLATQLEAFAANTVEHLLEERDLLLDGVGVPPIATSFAGRHAVVVAAGYDYRADLAGLRGYLKEQQPVLVGVDAGADALLEAGLRPDLVVGDLDLDAVSDAALTCGAELVVRTGPDGRAPGLERVQDLGAPATVFPASGTSEDVALLLADAGGAQLVVTVGSHGSLVEFLDRGPHGMASSFLTRLRVGSTLVDAKAVARLHRRHVPTLALLVLVLAAVAVMAAAVVVSLSGTYDLHLPAGWWDQLRSWLPGANP